jgi:uncharacterized protein (DUF2345 family)
VVSANASVEFAAKQVIHLAVSGGAFIHLEGGNITFGCPGKLTVHAGNHKLVGGTNLQMAQSAAADTRLYSEQFVLRDKKTNEPLPFTPYRVEQSDGQVFEGISDAHGQTLRLFASKAKKLKVFVE